MNFLISSLVSCLTHSLFNSMLFNLHEFEWFWVLSLRLVSTFRPLWPEKMRVMTSILLNLWRRVLSTLPWSIFENVPCAFEKNRDFASSGCKALSLCIYHLSPLDVGQRSIPQCLWWYFVWKIRPSLTVGVGILYYNWVAVNISLEVLKIFCMCWGASMLGAYIFTMLTSYEWSLPLSLMKGSSGTLLMSFRSLFLFCYEQCYPESPLKAPTPPNPLARNIFSSSPHSVCVGHLFWGGSLVGSLCVGHASFSLQLLYVSSLGHIIHLCLRLLLMGTHSLLVSRTGVYLCLGVFVFNFYCYSVTVVCLFCPTLQHTPAEPTSLPDIQPPLPRHHHPAHPARSCPCVLHRSSCNPLLPQSPPHSPMASVRLFSTSMSLCIYCLLYSSIDYVPVKGGIIWYLSLTAWLISFSIMLSSSILALAQGVSSSFLSAA